MYIEQLMLNAVTQHQATGAQVCYPRTKSHTTIIVFLY